jgi:hypothetical protein
MRYLITLTRVIDDKANEPVVMGETRRFTGAVNVRDALVEASLSNQRTHNPDGRVIQGPGHRHDVFVTSMYPDGTIVEFIHSIVEKKNADNR